MRPPRRLSRAARRGRPSEGATRRARLSRCSPRSSSAPPPPRAVDPPEAREGPSCPAATAPRGAGSPGGREACSPRGEPSRRERSRSGRSARAGLHAQRRERNPPPHLYCQTEYVHAPTCCMLSPSLCSMLLLYYVCSCTMSVPRVGRCVTRRRIFFFCVSSLLRKPQYPTMGHAPHSGRERNRDRG